MVGAVVAALWSAVGWIFTPISLTVVAVTFACVYYQLTKHYDFWPSRGVPGPRAKFPWGSEFGPPLKSFVDFEDWIYDKHGGKQYCGYVELQRPVLYVGDLDLIRAITIKDFECFTDRRDFSLSEEFADMLHVLRGKQWKDTRTVMSPTFSSSKLKHMHQLCLKDADNLNKYVQDEMQKSGEIDLRDAFGRFTMNNISSCAFGVDCNSFVDPNSEFAENAAKLFKAPSAYGVLRLFANLLFGLRAISWLPDPYASINTFFKRVIANTIEHRERHGQSHADFLQLLLDTKDNEGRRVLTDSSIVAQSVLFFTVGYDTTTTLLTFAAYCLATEPEWQRCVHAELDEVFGRHGGQLTYEAVAEMAVLDRVVSETLRLYPPGLHMERECNRDYTLPGTSVTIPCGTLVRMPILKVHRDPEYYPDPLQFDPDRFLPEQKEQRHPCSYVPFGSGPRNCIAMRFALFEAKVALITVLRHNRLEPGPRTPSPPMPLDKDSILLSPAKGATYLKAVPRQQN